MRWRLPWTGALVLVLGCGPADLGRDVGAEVQPTDAASVSDAALALDAAGEPDAGHAHPLDASLADAWTEDAGPPDAFTFDAGPPVLHDCRDFVDLRAPDADRTVRFDSSPSLAYTPACMRIAAGQSVVFSGPFARHPLTPGRSPWRPSDPEGSPGSPMLAVESGTTAEFVFPDAGSFPFYCPIHDLSGMVGVIRVE